MSYCRFSSDNFRCDLYCYASQGGYTTHVASTRVDGDIPALAPLTNTAQFLESHRAQMAFLETATHTPIMLPHAGQDFVDADLAAFLDRLEGLRALGYHVPPGVLEGVREELADEAAEQGKCAVREPEPQT